MAAMISVLGAFNADDGAAASGPSRDCSRPRPESVRDAATRRYTPESALAGWATNRDSTEAEIAQIADAQRVEHAVEVIHLVLHHSRVKITYAALEEPAVLIVAAVSGALCSAARDRACLEPTGTPSQPSSISAASGVSVGLMSTVSGNRLGLRVTRIAGTRRRSRPAGQPRICGAARPAPSSACIVSRISSSNARSSGESKRTTGSATRNSRSSPMVSTLRTAIAMTGRSTLVPAAVLRSSPVCPRSRLKCAPGGR